MTAEFGHMLREIQQYASGLGELVDQARSRMPASAEATDGSGAVRVRLGADNLPETVQVTADWRRRISSTGFGNAVVDACQRATQERMSTWWATMQREGWQTRAEQLERDTATATPGTAGDPMPPELRQRIAEARPRPLAEITEDMLRAAAQVTESARQPAAPATATGTAASGSLSVTVSEAGLVSCVAEPEWASRQTGGALAAALDAAIGAARTGLGAARQRATTEGNQLDALLVEALALLSGESGSTASDEGR